MITVFYDGKCSLCSKEIAYYKKIAPSDKFTWCDITLDSNPLTQRGFSLRNGLMFFHVEDENGTMHTSLDAFIIVWKELRGWSYIAKIASLPVLKPLVNRVYKIFATYRFKKMATVRLNLNDKRARFKHRFLQSMWASINRVFNPAQ